MSAAYDAPGSLWRVHMEGERYAVDVKLPGVAAGDEVAATQLLTASGLECSWAIPVKPPAKSAEVVMFRPAAAVKQQRRTAASERRMRGR